MALMTAGALLVGLAVVAFAVMRPGAAPADPSGDLVSPVGHVPQALADGRTLGSAEAPVTVEIWSDFQCPACRQFAERTEPSIISSYVVPGTARLVYRDAAFQGQRSSSPYDESVESAAAARCAADQGLFWEMHGWIFANWAGENRGAFRADRLRLMAGSAGLDLARYDSCMAAGDKQTAVRAETREGTSSGIDSTPTIVVNGQAFAGSLAVPALSQLIEQAAAAAQSN